MYKSTIFDSNPLATGYSLGHYLGPAGPENAWKLFLCTRRSDNREFTLFLFEKRIAEKLHKPRRKETITEILRSSARQLERLRHPKILQIVAPLEESSESLGFVTEPLLGSLNNIGNLEFLELELKYGFLQVRTAQFSKSGIRFLMCLSWISIF
jgi:SCY1-like protein 2